MEALFSQLNSSVAGTAGLALAASFAWGVLSIVLSPCHLASIPLIVGFIDDQGGVSPRRSFLLALFFSLGILLTIAAIGLITATAGRMLGDLGPYVNYLVAAIFFIFGFHLLEIITLPLYGAGNVRTGRKGILAGFTLGLLFGLALGPCTFAFMAPMLGITFKVASGNPVYGSILLLFYGVGHCSVIVTAGTATGLVQSYLNWNENAKSATILKRICGALVLAGGLYLLYTA